MALLKKLFRGSDTAFAHRAGRDAASLVERTGNTCESEHRRIVAAAAGDVSEGRYAEALARVSDALATAPDDVELVFARGSILFEWGRHWEARKPLLRADALGMQDKTLYERLGWTFMWTTGASSAEDWMRKAVSASPESWMGHFGLATSLRFQGKTEQAVAGFDRALALSPDNVNCLVNLAECKTAQNQLELAEDYARRAIAVHRESVLAWSNLGIVLIAQYRFQEAAAAFERAESVDAASGGGSDQGLNLGNCLRDMGNVEDAIDFYARRLPERPSASGHAHYAYALLTGGRLAEGWAEYEFRWLQQPLLARRPSFRMPVWAGQDLHGKAILLRTEQGIGDVVQFIRYAPHLKALGATVLLQVRPGVGDLARGFPGVDRILDPAEPYPDFDFYIHLMSLPRVFGTDLASVPNDVPYLSVDPVRRARWKDRLQGGKELKVGLVWAGDPGHLRDRYRSVLLSALAPIAEVAGVQFYSLQKGPAATQLDDRPDGMRLIDLGPELQDFADTAAVIDQLDLLIGVDTSVVHIAGALGKPAWVLIPSPADWRWMNDRQDSPWYPTLRLFRQHVQGEWDEVIVRVKEALEARARDHSPAIGALSEDKVHFPSQPLSSIEAPRPLQPGMSAVAETAMGIVQYFPDQPLVGDSIGWYGEYLWPQTNLLTRLMKVGDVVMEVGSGVGAHVLSLRPAIGDTGHFFLYESRPLYQRVLRQNLAANGIANVTVMKRPQSTETVDELRLDALDWLKINENSDAFAVLDGAAESLWRMRPRLFIAASGEGTIQELTDRVSDFGYQCWRLETPYFNPVNFNRREADIFSGRVAFAVIAIPEEIEFDIAFDRCVKLA